jgi:L-lactate dehydrogenase complex protein LldG
LGIEAISVGLTGADAAFAATGTLLMHGGPGRPLLVNQLPRRHIILLAASRLYPSLERWLAQQLQTPGRPAFPSSVTTLLTGPSRSADIEVTPAYGVHGPGKLHVLVIQGR